MKSGKFLAVGHDSLAAGITGLTQLGQHGAACIQVLNQAGATFDRLDRELAGGISRVTEHG